MSGKDATDGDTMNRKRTISTGLAAAGAAAVIGGGLARAPASAAAKPAPKYVVLNCSNQAVTRPASWTPYCADYGIVLSHMRWGNWDSHMASGYGTVSENDNYPSHAEGKTYTVPALVTLWGSRTVRNHPGERSYTEMTLVFPGQRPPVYKLSNGKWTVSYPVTQTLGV